MCSHVPHQFIFHISPYFAPKTLHWCLREACSYVEVTAAYAMNMTCAADHTIYSVCASAAAGKNTTTHTCMQTHAHTQTIYMDASCIWSLPSLSSCLKAPWEICKLADAQHCRSYPDPHTGLWLSHPIQTHKCRLSLRTRVWPTGFLEGMFMNIYSLALHTRTKTLQPLSEAGGVSREKCWLVCWDQSYFFH